MWKTKEELRGHTWQYTTVHVLCMLITKATDTHSEYVHLTAFPLPVDGSSATIWNTVLCYNQKYMLTQKHTIKTLRLILLHSVIKVSYRLQRCLPSADGQEIPCNRYHRSHHLTLI
jgi:hypothetical protein